MKRQYSFWNYLKGLGTSFYIVIIKLVSFIRFLDYLSMLFLRLLLVWMEIILLSTTANTSLCWDFISSMLAWISSPFTRHGLDTLSNFLEFCLSLMYYDSGPSSIWSGLSLSQSCFIHWRFPFFWTHSWKIYAGPKGGRGKYFIKMK